MKRVFVIRHSAPDYATDSLTAEGVETCHQIKRTFPVFDLVYSSPSGRTQQTAYELTGIKPILDERAFYQSVNIPAIPTNGSIDIKTLFSFKEALPASQKKGEEMVELIKNILRTLQQGQTALLTSHSWSMTPAFKMLQNESFDTPPEEFQFLEGFIVNEDLSVSVFRL